MTIVGAQDFQSGEQWQSQLLGNFSQFLVGGASHTWPDTGPATIPVANWQGTQVKVNAASAADWVFNWWANAAGTFQLGQRRFTTSAFFTDTYLTLANLGPYLTITATNGAVGNNTASTIIIGTNRILAPFQPGSSGPMIYTAPTNVIAAGQATVNASYLYAGPAALWTATTATAWRIDINGVTSDSVATFVSQLTSTETGVGPLRRVALILPPRPAQIVFHNDGAGAADFYASLTPDMFR